MEKTAGSNPALSANLFCWLDFESVASMVLLDDSLAESSSIGARTAAADLTR
jgi:hypothetical protein